jgi:hypothetical protein
MMNSRRPSAAAAVTIVFITATISWTTTPSQAFRSATLISIQRTKTNFVTPLYSRRYDDDRPFDEDDQENYYEDEEYDERPRRRRRPRVNMNPIDDLGEGKDGLDVPSPFGRRSGLRLPDSVSKSLLAGIFVLGIGTGVTVDSAINTNERDLASRDAIDRNAPNPELCSTYGASAMAFDQRVFVSFNPFAVYVAQADVKPACVLLPANVVPILRERNMINDAEVRSCKKNMNTWAYVGDLDDMPQLSCVYQSEDAQNEFLSNPKLGIGEDVWDDDRAKATGKLVKDGRKGAQLQKRATDAETVRK